MSLGKGFCLFGLLVYTLQGQEVPRTVAPLRGFDATLPRRIPDAVRNAPTSEPVSVGPLSRSERLVHRRGPLVQAGVRRAIPRAAWTNAAVSVTPDGQSVLAVSLRSPGASRIRLHFRDFHAGSGQAWVFAPGTEMAVGPYTGDGVTGDGAFWAGGVEGDTVTVAYLAPAGHTPARFPFTVDSLAHVWTQSASYSDPAASCNLDVTCYPAYRSAAAAVVEYDFIADDGSGTYICSGAMINTRRGSLKPYLLTANHCISSDTEAKSMQAYFLYQTAQCNTAPPSLSSVPSVLSGTYVAGGDIPNGDFALVLLHDVPGGVTFLGWNTSLDAGAAVVGIHHPRGSYTRIAFGNHGVDTDVPVGTEIAPAAKYYEVNWTQGLTEPGSSGSPLLDANGAIVGILTGAAAPPPGETVCDSRPFSLYGRFSSAYAVLSPYLEDGATPAPTASQVSLTVMPNPVYEQPPDPDGFQWSFSVQLAETAGVTTTITRLKIGAVDYTSEVPALFAGTRLAAWGTLKSGSLRLKNMQVPFSGTVEIDGIDPQTFRAWQVTAPLLLLGPQVIQPPPAIISGGIGNAASGTASAAPGSLINIFGTNLALDTLGAPRLPLPRTLGGTIVSFNGISGPLVKVSPTQLMVQVPFEVSPGIVQVTVTVGGQSATDPLRIVSVAPGVFTLPGGFLYPVSNGRAGDVLSLYITGQGPLAPGIATGTAPAISTPVAQLPQPVEPVQITIGGVPATVLFAGDPSGLVGLTQVNFQVPSGVTAGDQPLIVTVGDLPANAVTFTVNP
jgi:uncharacterized protein (TIGR03437 family)